MTADRHDFLRAIKANPDDDTRRLVFADWLDDHDEPERAELIRVQVEIRRLPRVTTADQRKRDTLVARWRKGAPVPMRGKTVACRLLRERVLTEWFGESLGIDPVGFVVDRGILEQVTCSAAAWLAHGDAVYAREWPWRVRLTGWVESGRLWGRNGYGCWWQLGTRPKRWVPEPKMPERYRDHPFRGAYELEWPDTAFELPPEPGIRARIDAVPRRGTRHERLPGFVLARLAAEQEMDGEWVVTATYEPERA